VDGGDWRIFYIKQQVLLSLESVVSVGVRNYFFLLLLTLVIPPPPSFLSPFS